MAEAGAALWEEQLQGASMRPEAMKKERAALAPGPAGATVRGLARERIRLPQIPTGSAESPEEWEAPRAQSAEAA
ncbi:hypothetical protein ACWKT5_23810 [Streptomyces avermitilis]